MKKIAISLVGLLLASNAFALSARIGGFAALDLLTYLKKEDQNATYDYGIGVLDMKIYARHKKFSSKVKFDLDDKSIKHNVLDLVEEFTVSWQPNWDWKVTAGRGKAQFHRLHWGATEHCYTDGGAILSPKHTYRDLDQRPVVTVRYGNYRKKFMNHVSVFGNPVLPKTGSGDGYSDRYAKNTRIDFTEERGITDKFEWFPTRELSLSASALYYKHDLNPHANYAFDTGGRYRSGPVELWFEYIWGRNGAEPNVQYSVFNSYENTFQLGGQYEINDLVDFILSTGGTMVRYKGYYYDSAQKKNFVKSYGERQNNFKVDTALKFKVAKSTQITFGSLFEKQYYKKENGANAITWGYQISSGLSMWF